VNGSGHPTEADMIAMGAKGKLKAARCKELREEVLDNLAK
jgi:hypothetical protein